MTQRHNDRSTNIMSFIGALIFSVCVWGTIGALIGEKKNLKSDGMWLGILLGPIGILIITMRAPAAPPKKYVRMNDWAKPRGADEDARS